MCQTGAARADLRTAALLNMLLWVQWPSESSPPPHPNMHPECSPCESWQESCVGVRETFKHTTRRSGERIFDNFLMRPATLVAQMSGGHADHCKSLRAKTWLGDGAWETSGTTLVRGAGRPVARPASTRATLQSDVPSLPA